MEALRIGFTNCIIPAGNYKAVKQMKGIEGIKVQGVENVQEALDSLM